MFRTQQQSIRIRNPGLVLIDNQVGLTHPTHWGTQRSNEAFEENLVKVLAAFRAHHFPIFHVAHHSVDPASPLNPIINPAGAEFLPFAKPHADEPVFVKNVNSAFIGTRLEEEIRAEGVTELFIAGLTTDHCVSTSTRMAANLHVTGKQGVVYVVGDAVANWERGIWDAQTVQAVHLASLNGEFAEIVETADVINALGTA